MPADDLAFFINDQLIRDVTYSETDMSITINIRRNILTADGNWLYLVCRPWRIVRRLGSLGSILGLAPKGMR